MKTSRVGVGGRSLGFLLLTFSCGLAHAAPAPQAAVAAQAQRELGPARPSKDATAWEARARSDHQTEWFSVRRVTNAATGRVRSLTNSYTELATHLNVQEPSGRWRAADPSFQITGRGAEVTAAAQEIFVARDISSLGSVRVRKGGVTLESHPLCVALYDPVTGHAERIAEITNAAGGAWLVSPRELVFSNCFNGLKASIRIRSSLAGYQQDLILHERLPVTPADLGHVTRDPAGVVHGVRGRHTDAGAILAAAPPGD